MSKTKKKRGRKTRRRKTRVRKGGVDGLRVNQNVHVDWTGYHPEWRGPLQLHNGVGKIIKVEDKSYIIRSRHLGQLVSVPKEFVFKNEETSQKIKVSDEVQGKHQLASKGNVVGEYVDRQGDSYSNPEYYEQMEAAKASAAAATADTHPLPPPVGSRRPVRTRAARDRNRAIAPS